ncbi:hypothetical protein EGW08_005657 [Elysia chlorotica]|uniref:VCBS repeat-containing protein n=1 Tax=Elysia chlorotica TaxID=188477 RepID=A0A433TYC4_ELYCH|nr:hypothetical protein EGW08_005657 [Elysia chlorotica]
MKSSPLVLIVLISAVLVQTGPVSGVSITRATLLGTFYYEEAGFISLFQNTSTQKYNLLLSSFGIFKSDVAVVLDVGSQLKNVSAITPKSLNKEMKWPNFIEKVPDQVLETKTPYIIIPDGFLVPGKEHGSLTLQPLYGGASSVISGTSGSWFFHLVQWVDMDKDGTLDALTCKSTKPLFGSFKGAMVWYKNPKDHSLNSPWKETIIAQGPDVLFEFSRVNVSGTLREIIVTAEFFQPRVRIFWTNSAKQDWSQVAFIQSRDIDTITPEQGSPFDVIVSDVNKDGNPDIVLSLNAAKNGTVVIYEFPEDFRSGTFKRHLIASGYNEETGGPKAGAPGNVELLPQKDPSQKPSILVAGDDSGIVSILDPVKPTDSMDWNYKRTDILHTEKSTTGAARLADVDGDGRPEIFVSSYQDNQIYVYRV